MNRDFQPTQLASVPQRTHHRRLVSAESIGVAILSLNKGKYLFFKPFLQPHCPVRACVCVRACLRACVRACVRVAYVGS